MAAARQNEGSDGARPTSVLLVPDADPAKLAKLLVAGPSGPFDTRERPRRRGEKPADLDGDGPQVAGRQRFDEHRLRKIRIPFTPGRGSTIPSAAELGDHPQHDIRDAVIWIARNHGAR